MNMSSIIVGNKNKINKQINKQSKENQNHFFSLIIGQLEVALLHVAHRIIRVLSHLSLLDSVIE